MATTLSISHLHLHLHLHGKEKSSSYPFLYISNLSRPSLSSSYRPMSITMSQNQSYWAAVDADIEAHLKKVIPIRPPISVFEPMDHLTFAAPKSTAPSLCIAACELVGGSPEDAMPAASALHLMHAAAFTHQHLPLTDRPGTQPGPTIHHEYEPNIELLTPDGIVPFGFELLGRSAQDNTDRILRVIIEISRAVGSQGMVDGRYREMLCSGLEEVSEEMTEYVCEKKEGELHACAAACGAIMGGGSEEEIEKLRRFGVYVGMVNRMGRGRSRSRSRSDQVVEKFRGMGLKELEIFSSDKAEQISTLLV